MNVPKAQRHRTGKNAPLSYERLAILVAVAPGPIIKAQIGDTVMGDTAGRIAISKSSLYRLINELTETGYLQSAGTYSLTDKGWRALHLELQRIEQQRLILKQRLHI